MNEKIWQSLKEEHRSILAPAALEAQVVAQFVRENPVKRLGVPAWAWAAAAVVLAATAFVSTRPDEARIAARVAAPQVAERPVAVPVASPEIESVASVAPAPLRRPRRPVASLLATARPIEPRYQDLEERTTEFFAVPGAQYLPPPAGSSVVRVQIPSTQLRRYGFDVPAASPTGYVRADFVVGQDGLARAIRLVQ